MAEYECPRCGMGFAVPDNAAEKWRCPLCGDAIAAPRDEQRKQGRYRLAAWLTIGLWICAIAVYVRFLHRALFGAGNWGLIWFTATTVVCGFVIAQLALLVFAMGYPRNKFLMALGALTFAVAAVPVLLAILLAILAREGVL